MDPSAKSKDKSKRDSGQAALEFAVSALVMFLLVFAVCDFSYLFFTKLTLQNAVRQGGRYAITGQSMSGKTRVNSILQTVQNTSLGLATTSNTTVCSVTCGCGCGGVPQDTVTIVVTYQYRFLTPLMARYFTGGTYTYTVSSSFRNEAFPPSQTY